MEIPITLRKPTVKQSQILTCPSKRIIVRGGRRGGKTVLSSQKAIQYFFAGGRVLYAAPTHDQVQKFWYEVNRSLHPMIEFGVAVRNKSEKYIEIPGTEQRIRAKTAWDPDTLRGDFGSLLILDEFHLMREDVWDVVGAPMLLDVDGDALFIFTPPSIRSREKSRGDPMHAAKRWRRAATDTTGRWSAFHFTSFENPHISASALADLTADITTTSYRLEILAEDLDEIPGALWSRSLIEQNRVHTHPPFVRCIVGIDPSATSTGDEAGIIIVGLGADRIAYVVGDESLQGSPIQWASAAVGAYMKYNCSRMVAEANQGGEMVQTTIGTIPGAPQVKLVHAGQGKATRAEPIAALTEQGRVKFLGEFPRLEDELCQWKPDSPRSPNRLDAFVHAVTELNLRSSPIPDYSKGGIRHAA